MTLASDLSKFTRKFEGTVDELIEGVEIALFTAVIMDTPVATGRARGNWFTSSNNPSQESTEATDKSGAQSIAAMQSFVSALKGGRVTFLTNNLPYIDNLEKGGSKQAPAGMVRKNVARFQRLVNEQALKVR